MVKNNKGFTLVEIAVVLVILGILAGITIPNVAGWVKDAEERSLVSKTKIAVKAAQSIIAKTYAQDGTPSYELTNIKINYESGLEGLAYGYEISDNGFGNELLHLSYTEGKSPNEISVSLTDDVYAEGESGPADSDHATYCSDPQNCDSHEKEYTFIKGRSYSYTDPENDNDPYEDDEKQKDDGTDPGNVPVPEPQEQNNSWKGFYLEGDNETVYVKAIDVYSKLQSQSGSGFNLSGCVIAVENGNVIEYYYIWENRNPWFAKSYSKAQLLEFVKSNTPKEKCSGTENKTQCCNGHIFYIGNSTQRIKTVARYDWMHTGTLTYKSGTDNSDPSKYQIFMSNNPHDTNHNNWKTDSQFQTLQWELPVS